MQLRAEVMLATPGHTDGVHLPGMSRGTATGWKEVLPRGRGHSAAHLSPLLAFVTLFSAHYPSLLPG